MKKDIKNTNEPLILAVETSGRMGSVALGQEQRLLGEQQFSGRAVESL